MLIIEMSDWMPEPGILQMYVGTTMTINYAPYQIKTILAERYYPIIAAWRAVFTGVRLSDNREVMLVFRVQ
jgi:hypothetical protein